MRALLPALALALATSSCSEVPFYCSSDEQCVRPSDPGFCEANHRCSFKDDGCRSGRRYAPFGTGEECVAEKPVCAVVGVTAGTNFTCAWSNYGHVSCWGDNANGQLGDGTTTARSTPKALSLANVTEVVAGNAHACALHNDGAVSCWGDNANLQLGVDDGTTANRAMPVKVKGLTQATSLATGLRHTCARRQDGSLYCWGRDNMSQLGDGLMMNRGAALRVAGTGTDVLEAAAGDTHTCALLKDGGLACWGSIRMMAIVPTGFMAIQGVPARVMEMPAATQITSGDNHVCAITGGEVYCFGANDLGQAGDRMLGARVAPTKVAGATGATELEAGANHTCALLGDGTIRCWGASAAAQTGGAIADVGNATLMPVEKSPDAAWKHVVAGGRHSCALTVDGHVYCWGRTTEGQLGDGTVLTWPMPEMPVQIADVAALAGGNGHTCALTRAGAVSCWGRGDLGQLGDGTNFGSSTPKAVVLPGPAAQVVAGGEFACVRLVDGTVQCWGRGNRGQIGSGKTGDVNRPTPVMLAEKVVHIGAGAEHACAVGMSGAVFCWGEVGGGRLGNNVMPTGIMNKPIAAMAPAEFTQVTAGMTHTCALSRTRQVTCWGTSTYGQVGLPTSTMPTPPTPVAGLADVTALASGNEHMCAVTADGTAWCWGRGDSGQLGFGTTNQAFPQPVAILNFKPVVSISASTNHTCAVLMSGGGFCWGNNRYGQLGSGTASQNRPVPVVKIGNLATIEAGDRHTCAALTDGSVYCWGGNQWGQLGNGSILERPEPRLVGLDCP
jgi:alpha-tubulin suppressor-like RCC1 family protein